MQSSTYVSRRPGPFADLIAVAELGGFRLSPLAPVRVRDQYWDTADGELLRSGLSLRVRESDGTRTAALRPLTPDAAGVRVADAALGPEDGAPVLYLPPGPLADDLAGRLGADTLRPLLALRQYRTPRIAYDGARPALLVSLDVVVYEVPGAQIVSNEVEVEMTAQGTPDDVQRLDPALRGFSLAPEPRTKLERGLLRLSRDLADPVLLLPDERAAIERIAERGDAGLRRRARVLLLDARGYRADTVASQTGLSAARVRHWKEQFLARRLAIFEPDETPASPYRVSELVDAGGPLATEAPDAFTSDAPAQPTSEAPASEAPPAETPSAPPSANPLVEDRSGSVREAAPPRTPAGDGALDDSLGSLLEQFSPASTSTPFLDAPGDDEDDDPEPYPDEDETPAAMPAPASAPDAEDLDEPVAIPATWTESSGAGMPGEPEAATPDAAEPADAEADDARAERAQDATAPTGPVSAVSDPIPSETVDASPAPPAEDEPAAPPATTDAPRTTPSASAPEPAGALRAPALPPETPLVDAAFATLVYHVARFEGAADRFSRSGAGDDARRVLLAAHRVRLAAEAFRPYVPAMAVGRLVGALRPLVAALDETIDHEHALATAGAGTVALAAARDRAAGRAQSLLRGGRHRAWGPRARRLLDRLGAQHDAGLLVGDDFPAPPDDLVGEPGDVPVPSRLRHAAASMLWARYEAIRAFEDDVDGATSAETAYHLALAVSGLHFVLGLVTHAPTPAVRALAARLDAAEARLAGYRQARRTADLTGAAVKLAPVVAEVWDDLVSEDVRGALADVAAHI